MVNKKCYPITHQFEEEYKPKRNDIHPSMAQLKEYAADMLNEYEHGTVDIADLGVDMEQCKDVIIDFLTYVESQ